jgi:hypothetical protein
MGMKGRRTWIAALVAMAIAAVAVAAPAAAELTARGDLFVRFGGGIAPDALPRHARAPISVSIVGTVRTLSGERPPALRRIAVAINQGGEIDSRGLPVCRRGLIEPSSSAEALERCGSALVGRGSYDADVAFPEQSAFPSHGRILAFNAELNGKRAILAHVYGAEPVPITRIVVFRVEERRGTFGTVLRGDLPATLNRWGYLRQISLELHREYTYRGQRRSYLSAACSAPAGFPGATFPFARASMGFADGRTLSSTLTRSCTVRGG